jgi:hypothetical protein
MSKCLQLENDRVVVENEAKREILQQTVKRSAYVKSGGNETMRQPDNQNSVSISKCYCYIKIITHTALKCSLVCQEEKQIIQLNLCKLRQIFKH